jgi:hypothetical protein
MKRFILTVILILLATAALAEDVFYPIVIKKCPPPPMELAWTNATPTVMGTYYFRPIEADGSNWAFLAMYDVAAPMAFPWPVQFAGPVPVPAGAEIVGVIEIPVPGSVTVPLETMTTYADQLTNSTGQ